MTRVMSYTLFEHERSPYCHAGWSGDRGFRFFRRYLPWIVRAHHMVFQGYELRIHHDAAIDAYPYGQALRELERRGFLRLVDCGRAETLCGSMLWRMLPIWDPEVSHVWCRDVDSIPLPRDRWACEAFVASGKAVHSLHDSTSHGSNLCGGLVGFDCARFRQLTGFASLADIIAAYGCTLDQQGADQMLLNSVVAPRVRDQVLNVLIELGAHRAPIHPVAGLEFDADLTKFGEVVHLGGAYRPPPVHHFMRGKVPAIDEAERAVGIDLWTSTRDHIAICAGDVDWFAGLDFEGPQ